jgi:nucleotidyltransferase/DNA polymerase involved in DNA repair
MNCNRVACVLIPNFGLNVQLQQDLTLLLEAVALAENPRETAVVLEVNGKAERAGIRSGLTVAQAHSLCPDLNIVLRREKLERSESQRLTRCLQDIAPFVESDLPGVFFLEADGLKRLYGAYDELAEKLIAKIKVEQYPVSVGVAPNKFTARVAAEVSHRYHCTCVPEGCQREFLANLGITHLRLDEEMQARLLQLGLRTMGQLAAFPANELQERFGTDGRRTSLLSRGEDPEYLLPETLPEELSTTSYPTAPLYSATTTVNRIKRLLEQLFVHLEHEARGCRSLAVRLFFTDKSETWLTLSVANPTVTVKTFVRQLAGKLEKTPFHAAVTEITVIITEVAPLQIRQMLLTGESDVNLHRAKADAPVTGILAQSRFYRPRLNYSPVPEKSFELLPLRAVVDNKKLPKTSEKMMTIPCYSLRRISGLRLLASPCEAKVIGVRQQPEQLFIDGQRQRIRHLTGPWKLSGNWWDHNFSRQYYEVETLSRKQYLLYYDTISARWFLQGIFD